MTRPRRIFLSLGMLTIFLAAGGSQTDFVRFAVYRFQHGDTIERARTAVVKHNPVYNDDGPSEATAELFADGEFGIRAVTELLDDDDPKVWTRVIRLLDGLYLGEAVRGDLSNCPKLCAFIRTLRSRSKFRAVKYLLPPPYTHGTDWRGYRYRENGEETFGTRSYWLGESGARLRPSKELLALSELCLFDATFAERAELMSRDHLRSRVISLLSAMQIDPATSNPHSKVQALIRKLSESKLEDYVRERLEMQFDVGPDEVSLRPEPSLKQSGNDR
ncbi:MAG: hypothetical protein AAF517_24265 [Planctomycetota bacterium]